MAANTLEILEEKYDVSTNTSNVLLEINGHGHNFDIIEEPFQLLLSAGHESKLEVMPDAFIHNQFFSGEGAVADQDTILGDGTQFDVLRAPDMLRISLKLGEFETHADKVEARDNLGLNVIDGGTFT